MNMFTSEEMNKRLSDFGIIIKYMPFLQDHGFTEFGKGQLIGKMELLKEGFSDSTTNHLEDGEKNPTGSKAAQRIDVHDAIDQSRRKKYIAENNKWNFKNEDEYPWITRIRKLADV